MKFVTYYPRRRLSRGRFSPAFVCLSVCLSVYPHDIPKTAAARINKFDVEMFYNESWKPVYFGVNSTCQKHVKVTRHKKAPALVIALLWVLASFIVYRATHIAVYIQGGPKKWYLSYITLHCTRGITFLAHPVDLQWRNSFFIYASCSARHDVGQGNVNICGTYSQIAEMVLALSFSYRFNFI